MYFATKNGMPRTEDLKELKELSAVPVSVFAVSDYFIQAQLSEFQRASTITGLQLGKLIELFAGTSQLARRS